MSQYTSYYLYQKYVSYDNGSTWTPVYPEEYSISGDSSDPQTITKKQDNDPECGYTPPVIPQYRWVEDGDNYICDDCGYTPTPQYRTISGTPYCTGYDKMVDTQYQVSYDSGSTWSTVSSSTLTVEHNSQDCGYVPPTPPSSGYANQYLTFRALESGTFSFTNSGMSYSLDSGSTWNTLTASANTPTVQSGQTIMWKGTLSASSSNRIGTFSSTGRFEVEGNTMSLKYGDNFSGQTTLNDNHSFAWIFSGCTGLTSAENLVLPATTLANSCYALMFAGCSSLTTAPELPATTLANYCYGDMFNGCTNLTTAPTLHATTLATYCYASMFAGCSSLTTAPELPATTLASFCYYYMFSGCASLTTAPTLHATTLATYCYMAMFYNCSSLTTAPELPATTLADWCYISMFQGCTSLTTAPELPATELTESCYTQMFQGCTSLVTAPELPATTLANYCYSWMFINCTSLTTAPELPATELTESCYTQMFQGCTNLSSITCLATDISATGCTDYWAYNVARSGTFTKAASMSNWPTGTSGIPSGWTVQDYQG